MLDQNLFTTHEIQQHEIEVQDGTKHVFNFKPLSAADFGLILAAYTSNDMEQREQAYTRAIAKSVCDADGKPLLTTEQAATLKPEVFIRFWNTIFNLNYNEEVKN